jgi:hypothetical protein
MCSSQGLKESEVPNEIDWFFIAHEGRMSFEESLGKCSKEKKGSHSDKMITLFNRVQVGSLLHCGHILKGLR